MIVNPVNTTEAREISSFRKYLFKVPGILIRTPNFINYDKQVCNYLIIKSPLPGSNQRPTDYKSVALPAELRRLITYYFNCSLSSTGACPTGWPLPKTIHWIVYLTVEPQLS